MKGKLGIGFDTFQFTPLREGRLEEVLMYTKLQNFNSRPSARGDLWTNCAAVLPKHRISIHAPPRGATGHLPSRIPRRFYFNSRPSARGDFAVQKG